MNTKLSLLILALLFVCSEMMAQEKITIGVIQYDLGDVNKSFKDLHDQGFGSCELNYQKNKFTKDFAEKVKAASKKHNIKVERLSGCPEAIVFGISAKGQLRLVWCQKKNGQKKLKYIMK